MTVWPSDYSQAWTLKHPVERRGVALHSGASTVVRLQAAAKPGYWVGWLDQPSLALVQLHPDQVADTQLCTALRLDAQRLARSRPCRKRVIWISEWFSNPRTFLAE